MSKRIQPRQVQSEYKRPYARIYTVPLTGPVDACIARCPEGPYKSLCVAACLSAGVGATDPPVTGNCG